MRAELCWIEGAWPGRLAIAPRPRGGDWLEDEIGEYRAAGIDVVVSLLADDEPVSLMLLDEEKWANAFGMLWMPFPISDRMVPESKIQATEFVGRLVNLLRSSKNVLVHCRQGIGRAGMIAASVLIALGLDSDDAVRRVSSARKVTIPETDQQRTWISEFKPLLGVDHRFEAKS